MHFLQFTHNAAGNIRLFQI